MLSEVARVKRWQRSQYSATRKSCQGLTLPALENHKSFTFAP